jgi:hypothetical protein
VCIFYSFQFYFKQFELLCIKFDCRSVHQPTCGFIVCCFVLFLLGSETVVQPQTLNADMSATPVEEEDLEVEAAGSTVEKQRWSKNSFLKPLQLSAQLSGFPNLHMLYSIFCCLPVSSASAERALSKLKIVKNRLRTSMSDDTLSSLLVLAAEKDIMAQLSIEDIIVHLVKSSPSLKSYLLF